ncbi:uncharacterized protein LTR77_002134 [Saxophila tyrrhenica]|uniref:Fungal N-terminal domain-containing protein n=1 Tax=Saxophila tyrrhenica TaxID=1690608 RepID=A0AAV9PMB2_9PEZI|nr:hypothetical protein LTR77_002134 [Saxophila tyrrhenica]
MAEPFSLATGAIQVAGAGLQLAKTLYEFIDTVKTAHKHINTIAVEVKLTSSVLQHLGTLLKDHESEKLCSAAIVADAGSAFKGCGDAFREIDEAFRPMIRQASSRATGLSISALWAWPLKKGKLETLQANLERLKTTLLLMLSVVSYAREKKTRSIDLTAEKLQMLNLMKAKDDATKRHEELMLQFADLQRDALAAQETGPRIPSAPRMSPPPLDFLNLPSPATNVARSTSSNTQPPLPTCFHPGYPYSPSYTGSTDSASDASHGQVQQLLVECARVASQLSLSINKASMDWMTFQKLDASHIRVQIERLTPMVTRVYAHEQEARRCLQAAIITLSPALACAAPGMGCQYPPPTTTVPFAAARNRPQTRAPNDSTDGRQSADVPPSNSSDSQVRQASKKSASSKMYGEYRLHGLPLIPSHTDREDGTPHERPEARTARFSPIRAGGSVASYPIERKGHRVASGSLSDNAHKRRKGNNEAPDASVLDHDYQDVFDDVKVQPGPLVDDAEGFESAAGVVHGCETAERWTLDSVDELVRRWTTIAA